MKTITVQNISKLYSLEEIGATSFRDSFERWFYRLQGREDELCRVTRKRVIKNFVDENDPQIGPRPNTLWALKDINFSVKQGEIVGIIGKNGSGKSTLFKILSKITRPTNGRVVIQGKIASLLGVGTGFHPELSGRENIFLNGAMLGMKKMRINEQIDHIINFSEIEKFIDVPVKRYSSGMHVRLAFSIAAHLDAEVILLDEVLAVGDTSFKEKSKNKILEKAKTGRTVMIVSHRLKLLKEMCDRVIWIDQGHIRMDGNPDECIDEYLKVMEMKVDFKDGF